MLAQALHPMPSPTRCLGMAALGVMAFMLVMGPSVEGFRAALAIPLRFAPLWIGLTWAVGAGTVLYLWKTAALVRDLVPADQAGTENVKRIQRRMRNVCWGALGALAVLVLVSPSPFGKPVFVWWALFPSPFFGLASLILSDEGLPATANAAEGGSAVLTPFAER